MSNWQEYYQITKNRPSSELLLRALSFVKHKSTALDLGAGALMDSKALIKANFNIVIAVDQEQVPEELIKDINSNNFKFIRSSFEDYNFQENFFDLINAQFALPFNSPQTFDRVFDKIKKSLKPGGIFVGQFFGIRDEWAKENRSMTFHTKEKVTELLADMDLLEMSEIEKLGKQANGQSKYWHFFAVIARKTA
jgi:tellurite methyltransferase